METQSNLKNLESERLPNNLKDISYDNQKDEISEYIANTYLGIKDLYKINKNKIEEEYELLQELIDFDPLHEKNLFVSRDGESDRYSDILPYKYNYISTSDGKYINASFISLPLEKSFIATQGPKANTVEEFWQMIYENNSYLIIMLCNLTEKKTSKCHKYWTEFKSEKIEISMSEEKSIFESLTQRSFRVKYLDKCETREINQLHFTGWPDHGIPEINSVYDTFDYMLRETEKIVNSDKPYPITVHCSAGVGRTGTFLAIYNNYHLINRFLEKEVTDFRLNIWNLVRKMKEQRRFLVENKNQYYFIYSYISKFASKAIK